MITTVSLVNIMHPHFLNPTISCAHDALFKNMPISSVTSLCPGTAPQTPPHSQVPSTAGGMWPPLSFCEQNKKKEGEREGGRQHFWMSHQTSGCFTMTFLKKNFLFEEISGINSAMFDRKIST